MVRKFGRTIFLSVIMTVILIFGLLFPEAAAREPADVDGHFAKSYIKGWLGEGLALDSAGQT